MAVRVTNTTSTPFILSGFREIGAGESIDVPHDLAIRYLKTNGLQFDFAGGALPFKTNGKVSHVTFQSNLMPTGGYGVIGLNAIRGLTARGVEVSVSAYFPDWLRGALLQHYPDVVPHVWRPDLFVSEVGLSHTVPPEFVLHPSPRRVGWTMWERTRLPRPWVDLCRQCERLIVPSSGMIPVFEESGVPIDVVPDGAGVEHFTLKTNRALDPEYFTFISWSRMSSRKCPYETVRCFQRAFEGKKDVRLIMKTIDHNFGMGTLGIPDLNDDRITIIDEHWPQEKLLEFCHNAHAAIFLSHGEGFYCPPTQAMATGLPVILSSHSGVTDQCDPRYNFPVPLHPIEPYQPAPPLRDEEPESERLLWWQDDYDTAIEHLRWVYNNREKARAKGVAAGRWVRKRFSIETMIDGLIRVLNKMD